MLKQILAFLEESGQLETVLAFVTGLRSAPPLGFNPRPTIIFNHPQDEEDEHLRGLVFANTCAHQFSIPVSLPYDQFKDLLHTSIFVVGSVFTNA